tara:strand:+ start:393 stop:857 length:465 start_codon:yes stop_codon:yes gene_type:complete
MTSLQAKLTQNLAKRLGKNMGTPQQGFTLVELLVVVVIVGILSAVALPQFFTQTKKAAATEGTQQASSIAKQASAYYLENGGIASGDAHTNCTAYAGTIKVDNTNFTYACSGSKTAFVVTATGKDANDNTKGVVVTFTGNLTDGTFSKPVVTGI